MAYYPEQQLMQGEEIILRAIPSYLQYSFLILIGIVGAFFSFGLSLAIVALWVYLGVRSQQIALTNKRVIGKYGIISRTVVDIPLSRVSSVTTDQSIIGRIFGYGDIILRGMGGEATPIPNISGADSFRSQVAQKIGH